MKAKKAIALTLVAVLLVAGSVMGTIAWLTDKTDEVKNVFTDSDINITLTETTEVYKMIPGWEIDKNPVVTVEAGSEDCWVFIKVVESGGDVTLTEGEEEVLYSFDDFIKYAIDKNWTALIDEDNDGFADDGVYYCKVTNVENPRKIKVLGYYDNGGNFINNKVLVKDTVTKAMMNEVRNQEGKEPTLTFTAYATQMWKSNDVAFTPEEAWKNIGA